MKQKKKILFISPEMEYTGALRSLLEMYKIAKELGYDVAVWSAKPGPFEKEYHAFGCDIRIVPDRDARSSRTVALIREFDLAICNTVLTDAFARVCCRTIPTIWYIHESVNLSMFITGITQRLDWLQNSRDMVCVSEFAAKRIHQYTKQKIAIVRNCMEDVSGEYSIVSPGTRERVRFLQLGDIYAMKGYDVLLDAFLQMPPDYQSRSELLFAGRIVPAPEDYGKRIVSEAEKTDNITYLGALTASEALSAVAETDVVVLASRGESCSMFAIEGAMMSKPMILTEDVGDNYLIRGDNGYIVKTNDADSLRDAIIRMIDRKDDLKKMGDRSRMNYEEMAGMDLYRREMGKLFRQCEKKNTVAFKMERARNTIIANELVCKIRLCKKRGLRDTSRRILKHLWPMTD